MTGPGLRLLLLLPLGLVACAADGPVISRGSWDTAWDSGAPDSDGDGVADAQDCAPDDPYTSSQEQEICNDGVDNDCDELVDGLDPDCA